MGRLVYRCANLEVAKGFVAGVDYVNDSALRVAGCKMTTDGAFHVIMEDDDNGSRADVPPEGEPVDISLEVLRDD